MRSVLPRDGDMDKHIGLVEDSCPRCKGSEIVVDPDTSERICDNCGLVVGEEVDRGPEWRAYDLNEVKKKRRAGMGTSYSQYDKGLSTTFYTNRDANGKRLAGEKKGKMKRLRKHDNLSKINQSHSRNLSIAMSVLDRLAGKLHIPDNVKEKAAVYYRQTLKRDLIRGRSIEDFVAASIYAACRKTEVPRPLETVSKVSTQTQHDVARTYRLMVKELRIKMPVDGPMKYVPRIASKLEIDPIVERHSMEMLRKASKRNILVGKDPRGAAAAALYIACRRKGEKRTQQELAETAGTTEVTLRNRMREIQKIQ
ncbi:MAG: transcription initiation factor IIB [Candidatus Bathyarchaeia archaeon]